MRIAHVITRLIIGGAQENTILSCEGLRELGYEVHLVAGPQTGPEGSLWPRAESGGYELHRVESLRREIRPFQDLKCLSELASLFESIRPDVVHTHSSKAGILGRLAAERAHVPIVVHTIHGMSFNRTQPWPVRALFHRLERHCGARTDHLVSVADAMTEQALAAGIGSPEMFSTIHSGMETELFNPTRLDRSTIRQAWGFPADAIVVGTVARLFQNKGYEQLLAVMPDCLRAVPGLRFVWVGDGSNRERYLARLTEMKLREKVVLTGLVDPADVPGLLTGMDVVAHLSQWEGLPRVLVQALLMETPVISFDNDGSPEVVIPGETGELVPLNDLRRLGEALSRLAGDAELRRQYGRAGRQRCLARFDCKTMVAKLDALYARLRDAGTEREA